MRIYNITTSGKFNGMYISEDDCGNFIYNVCLHANIGNTEQITMISNDIGRVLKELYQKENHVVCTLATVLHGNKNCVRLSAICAILRNMLQLGADEVLTIAHDLTEEWEDVEIREDN